MEIQNSAMNIFVSSLVGIIVLCFFATLQKNAIGAPLVLKGYLVPFLFGAISGGLLGSYTNLLKSYNKTLEHRVHKLEEFLPICSYCKKIRKPETDPEERDSWVNLEMYISSKTKSQFSHGICPDCFEKHSEQ